MKAKEYVAKYGDDIMRGDNTALGTMLSEMFGEIGDITKARGIKTTAGAVAVVEEINTKFNSVCATLEKKMGMSVLKRNGLRILAIRQIPELRIFYEHHKPDALKDV